MTRPVEKYGRFMRDVWDAYADQVMPARIAAGLVRPGDEQRYRAGLITDVRRQFAYRAAAIKDTSPPITPSELAAALRLGADDEETAAQMEMGKTAAAGRALAEKSHARVIADRGRPSHAVDPSAHIGAARAALRVGRGGMA